jgi:hypothetical protein
LVAGVAILGLSLALGGARAHAGTGANLRANLGPDEVQIQGAVVEVTAFDQEGFKGYAATMTTADGIATIITTNPGLAGLLEHGLDGGRLTLVRGFKYTQVPTIAGWGTTTLGVALLATLVSVHARVATSEPGRG